MSRSVKILSNIYPWYLPRRNRELRTNVDICAIERYDIDIKVEVVRSLRSALIGNTSWAVQYGLGYLGVAKCYEESYIARVAIGTNWIPAGYVKRVKPDLLFCHEYIPLNAERLQCPIFYETAVGERQVLKNYRPGWDEDKIDRRYSADWRFLDWCAQRSACVNVREPEGARLAATRLPDHRDKFVAIPPLLTYVEPLDYAAVVEKQQAEKVDLVFVGNQARRKGLPILVRAMKELPTKIRERVRLVVVSQFLDGPVVEVADVAEVCQGGRIEMSELFSKSEKQGPLTFKEIEVLLRKSQIFILPTSADTFGYVFIEAMAAGCAIVGPNKGPQRYILDDGNAGVMCDVTNVRELAGAIEHLVIDRQFRARIAENGYRRFLSTFHHSVVGKQYATEFRNIAEKWNGRMMASGR
ncbi:glycosyltransferase family 4 protein [uncultured Paludibaculum sp.]|uniref:glycosyltransferase family 4 protein n=1 Tax=uncultured Paludibaculum sp. TaxID=1765020 RepID=UPI002AAB0BDD|nr:glycosyltransferase family 4 protein [uncultured Paludibaculum sp.]